MIRSQADGQKSWWNAIMSGISCIYLHIFTDCSANETDKWRNEAPAFFLYSPLFVSQWFLAWAMMQEINLVKKTRHTPFALQMYYGRTCPRITTFLRDAFDFAMSHTPSHTHLRSLHPGCVLMLGVQGPDFPTHGFFILLIWLIQKINTFSTE